MRKSNNESRSSVRDRSDEELPLMTSLSSSSLSTSREEEGSIIHHDDWKRKSWTSLVLSWLWRKESTTKGTKDEPDNQEEKQKQWRRLALAAAAATLVAAWFHQKKRRKGGMLHKVLPMLLSSVTTSQVATEYRGSAQEAPLSQLWTAAKKGLVRRARLLDSQSAVAFQLQDGTWRRSRILKQNPSFQSTLVEALAQGGCADVSTVPESFWSSLAAPALAALPFVYLALLYKMLQNLHNNVDPVRTHGRDASHRVTFRDVAGLDSVVTEVSEVVNYLDNPHTYHGLGARPPRGILLYGPPGSGKTLLARAVAGEAQCEVFVACSGSDFVESYVGRGAARIRSLFDRARAQARGKTKNGWFSHEWFFSSKTPPPRTSSERTPSAVVFMDEIDAIAKSRSGVGALAGNEERDQTLNQLLTEIDGFASHEDVTMIFIAATNRPDVLDPAILRRFDRRVHVGYPDEDGRRAILEIHVRNIHHGSCLDLNQLASDSITRGFSGADLRNVVNDAALLAVRDKSPVVRQSHLLHAARRVKAMKTSLANREMENVLSNLPPLLR